MKQALERIEINIECKGMRITINTVNNTVNSCASMRREVIKAT